MAEHEPAIGPEHREVVGDRLGVARADADIDERDAAPVRPLQMVGRHLRQVARRAGLGPAGGAGRGGEHDIARRHEAVIAVLADQRAAEADELVDVALVVGEQHEILEMLGRRAGVVVQPRERIVDALGGEEGERPRLVRSAHQRAVGDGVVGGAEVRQREMRLQAAQVRLRDVDDALLDDEGEGDRPRAHADMHRHAVMLQDVADLLLVIAAEEVGPRQRRPVGAGLEQHAVGEPRIDVQLGAADRHEDIRVAGIDAAQLAALRGRGEGGADRLHALIVDRGDARHRRRRVVEGLELARILRNQLRARIGTIEAVHRRPEDRAGHAPTLHEFMSEESRVSRMACRPTSHLVLRALPH